jgi:RHS repeat-associated protein
MIYSRGVSKKQGRQEISAPPGSNGEGVTISYAYNAAPRLITVTSSLVDSNRPATLLSALHYNSAGALLTGTLGNNLSETRTYDQRLRLASVTNGSIYSLTIPATGGYAPDSNILAANDNVNGNWTYGYDDFNRLLSASATGQAYTYDYDRYGNRWHQNGPHSSQLGFDASNRVTAVTGVSFDSAGNMLGDGTTTYTFDAENRISSSNNTANGLWCDTYNAEGQRVRKTKVTQGTCPSPTQSTSYDFLYDLSGREIAMVSGTGVWDRGEVYAGDRHLATYNNATTYFIHTDWLGTDRVRTTVSGTVYQACTSLPFGDNFYCPNSDATPMHFTGKVHTYESGIDDFGARYYTDAMGRFMSPDPMMVSWRRMVNPQVWNGYSYAGNNPLRYVDPTGQELVQLGQHTDDEIKKRQQEIKQELKNKDLSKDQKDALKKERNTLSLEKQGNQVVGNLLSKLDQNDQRNGLQLSNFTLSTDTKHDFAGAATPEAMQKLLNDQAFVVQNNKQFSGTIYIRTEPETGFYQMSQSNSDFGYYGASALSHEQVHLNGGGEYPAFQRQLGVFEGFQNFFQNPTLYRGLDESIRDGIKANQPH